MKTIISSGLAFLLGMTITGCASRHAVKKEQTSPAFIIKSNEPIAIMPFETESALSNLGGQLSDEVIVNLLEHAPDLKIIPATVVRNYLLSTSLNVTGLPDMHTIHSLKDGLQCKYLLTGNLFTHLGDVNYTAAYSNRIATGSVTVRLVDCDSSYVVWARHVDANYTTSIYYDINNRTPTTYQTDGELLQGLIRNLGFEVAKNFYEH